MTRIKDLDEDCCDLNDRIGFKEKRITQSENVRDYKKCDDLKQEITVLKQQHRVLEHELKQLKKQNNQSKWYYKRR